MKAPKTTTSWISFILALIIITCLITVISMAMSGIVSLIVTMIWGRAVALIVYKTLLITLASISLFIIAMAVVRIFKRGE